MLKETFADPERGLILAVELKSGTPSYNFLDSLEELKQLVRAAGGQAGEVITQKMDHPHPKTYLGSGKMLEIKELLKEKPHQFVVVDDELSPNQHKGLSDAVGCRVLDRTHLILDIFAKRAHSRVGKLQVELAQLKYLFPRLVGMWSHFEKQEGAIGTRGPGETQLETDKRLLKKRIQFLEKQLEKAIVHHGEQRKQRSKTFQPLYSLVGYTNAGKTSLLNRLTGQNLVADDAVFTTLDAASRKVRLTSSSREVILSDTVGFIQRIPHTLVSSFKSTLEEVKQADALLVVVDISDPGWEDKLKTVKKTLEEVIQSPSPPPIIHVFNKVDSWESPETQFGMENFYSPAVFVSALTGKGMDKLCAAMVSLMEKNLQEFSYFFPRDKESLIHECYRFGLVKERRDEESGIFLRAFVNEKLFQKLLPFQEPS